MKKRWKRLYFSINLLVLLSYLILNGYIYHLGMAFVEEHPEVLRVVIQYHNVPPFSIPEEGGSIATHTGNYPSFFYFYSCNEQGREAESYLYHPSIRRDYMALNRRTESLYQGLITMAVGILIIQAIYLIAAIFSRHPLYGYVLNISGSFLIIFRKGMLSWGVIGILILFTTGLIVCMKGNPVPIDRNYLFPWIARKKKEYRFNAAYDERQKHEGM